MSGKVTRTGDPGQNFDEVSNQAQHSVELSRNAKGEYSWVIKKRYGLEATEDSTAYQLGGHLEAKKEG